MYIIHNVLVYTLGDQRSLINPRCACAARVTVVGSVYVCACLDLLSHIPPLELLFVLKIQRATEVKKFVAFSLKILCVFKVMASFVCCNLLPC